MWLFYIAYLSESGRRIAETKVVRKYFKYFASRFAYGYLPEGYKYYTIFILSY